jgi:YebC/PmpR family DNA-binding regulatory protein
MSGHSKWSTIKRKKGAIDAKRGKIFTKLIREITAAARHGGGDAESNPRLRQAITAARAQNMPSDNIDRAIKKATGELEGMSFEEITYEVYGPGGVAILVDVLTDNRNRTYPEIKYLLSKRGYALADAGSAAHNFDRRGQLIVPLEGNTEEGLLEIALEAGADDATPEGDDYIVLCDPHVLEDVRSAFEEAGVPPSEYGAIMHPHLTVPLSGDEADKCLQLVELIEDHDDVQRVWANFDISDEEMERLSST